MSLKPIRFVYCGEYGGFYIPLCIQHTWAAKKKFDVIDSEYYLKFADPEQEKTCSFQDLITKSRTDTTLVMLVRQYILRHKSSLRIGLAMPEFEADSYDGNETSKINIYYTFKWDVAKRIQETIL